MEKCQQMIRRKADEIQQNMFVIHQLVLRDKKRSLSSTFMGELWEVINPLINMVVLVLVFGKMFGGGILRSLSIIRINRNNGLWIVHIRNNHVFKCFNGKQKFFDQDAAK